MADPSATDKSLLDRLRALNPNTGVTQGAPSLSPATVRSLVIQPAKPPSREDALADRLRNLREKAEGATSASGPSRPAAAEAKSSAEAKSAPPPTTSLGTSRQFEQPLAGTDASSSIGFIPPSASGGAANEADYENLLETDDGVLEGLLHSSEADSVTGDPGGSDGAAKAWAFDPKAEAKKMDALMEKFQRLNQKHADAEVESDSEQMSRDVEKILAETLGDLKVDDPSDSPNITSQEKNEARVSDGAVGTGDAEEPSLSLPSVPSDSLASTGTGKGLKTTMPGTGNFDDDMMRRVAALRSPGPGTASTEADDNPLDLPSVPKELPSAPTRQKPGGSSGRVGFTDPDMETWCVACSEDATLICPGCDDDVFCSQCWYDMHKGPAAGYEESLHKPMQFNKERKKNKKTLVGAS